MDKIKKITEIYLKFYQENFNYGKLLMREIWGNNKNFGENINNIKKNHTSVIKKVIIDGQKSGKIRDDLDPESLAISFLGIINTSILYWNMKKSDFSVEKLKEDILNIYFTGVLEESELLVGE